MPSLCLGPIEEYMRWITEHFSGGHPKPLSRKTKEYLARKRAERLKGAAE